VRVVMATGDHQSTAVAIARQLGLRFSEDDIVDGRCLSALGADELRRIVPRPRLRAGDP